MNTYNLTPILKNLHTLSPYVIGSGVFTRDGLILESMLLKEQEDIGGYGAALSAVARQTALRVLQGNVGAALVKSDNGFFIVVPCEGELILAVIATLDAALNEMIQTVERIAEVIDQASFELVA